MIDLKSKCATQLRKLKIQIAYNPTHVFDLQFLLNTRLYFFKNSGGKFHIDFNAQEVIANAVYIVPPFHFQHLSKNVFNDFIAVDIDNRLLQSYHKQLLYFIKYNQHKSLLLPSDSNPNYYYEMLLQLMDKDEFDEQRIVDILVAWIESCFPEEVVQKRKMKNYKHIVDADNFLSVLSKRDLTINSCKINSLALEMFSTERNLGRICNSAFGLCAKDVVKYHLTAKAIYLLTVPHFSITDIAKELQFSSVTVFTRYMRRVTSFTPSEIRAQLRAAGL